MPSLSPGNHWRSRGATWADRSLLSVYAIGFERRWSGFLSVKLVRLDIPVVHLSLGRGRGTFHPRGGGRWRVGPRLQGVMVHL